MQRKANVVLLSGNIFQNMTVIRVSFLNIYLEFLYFLKLIHGTFSTSLSNLLWNVQRHYLKLSFEL